MMGKYYTDSNCNDVILLFDILLNQRTLLDKATCFDWFAMLNVYNICYDSKEAKAWLYK